jgi:hypothetical protein
VLQLSANMQVAKLHQMTLPRLGSRVRIPSSAPEKSQVTGLRGAEIGPSWRVQGDGAPHLHLKGVIRESVTDCAQNDLTSTY